ncbi:MAG: sugar phosphate isomerase/epimerase [Desulfarculus sp.]|nr:sugar phosphate isomerase/epimerase [Desulfarculus sp.]
MSTSPFELALSTSWLAKDAVSGAALAQAVQEAGISRLELEYRLSVPLLAELRRELKPRGLSVGSVHNYCPFPPQYAGLLEPSGDLFNLAAQDKDERRRAVDHTLRSLELASDLEAGAVVLHLGWLPELKDQEITGQAARLGRLTPELAAARELRLAASPRVLDALSFSLEPLLARAAPLGVRLGLENRFHLFQAPTLEETLALLQRFSGAPLGYWHDTGHARHRQLAGLNPESAYLERLGPWLLGCHLHDIKGVEDHIPPGQGDLDWPALAPSLLGAAHLVIELRPGPSPRQVAEAARLLEGVLAAARAAQQQGK